MSLKLRFGDSDSGHSDEERQLREHVHSDLCLYELACLFDSLPRILAFFVSDAPQEVNTDNFQRFRQWVCSPKEGQEVVKAEAPWIIDPLREPDLDGVKSLRNLRTHQISTYSSFLNLKDNTSKHVLSAVKKDGRPSGYDFVSDVQGAISALLRLLESITPSLDHGTNYVKEDILGSYMLGYPDDWEVGLWLEQFIPCLHQGL